jgi:hypothetical protein
MDNVARTIDTPDRGVDDFKPEITKRWIRAAVGSGQDYAIFVENMFSTIADAADNAAADAEDVFERIALRRGFRFVGTLSKAERRKLGRIATAVPR